MLVPGLLTRAAVLEVLNMNTLERRQTVIQPEDDRTSASVTYVFLDGRLSGVTLFTQKLGLLGIT